LIDSKIITIIMKYTVYVSVLFNSIFIVCSLFSFIFIGLLFLDLKIFSISRFPILIIINATNKITMILITLFNIDSKYCDLFNFIGLLLLDLKILSISRFPILIIINATIKITMILITLFNIVSQNSGPVNVSNHLFIVFDNI